jgi:hypothetical protein
MKTSHVILWTAIAAGSMAFSAFAQSPATSPVQDGSRSTK